MPIISGGQIMPGPAITVHPQFQKAGALVANDFAAGLAIGALGLDITNGKLYICTATNGTSTSTWTVVGAQT